PQACKQAHYRGVFLQACAKALVGDVEEGHQVARLDDLCDLLPLLGRRVDAGGVVAARVQHHDGLFRRGLQRGQHAREVQAMSGRVVVGIRIDREARAFEQRPVVLPAGVADQHSGLRQQLAQEVGADLQGTGAAQRLGGQDAAFCGQGGVRAQQQRLRAFVVAGDAFDRQVTPRRRGLDARDFRLAHRRQQRNTAIVVVVHTHAQVDFTGAGIGVVLFVQTQDGVARRKFDGIEKGAHGSSVRCVDARRPAVDNGGFTLKQSSMTAPGFVDFPDSPFHLYQPYPPAGDQPTAIDSLVQGIQDGLMYQTLLGVTGSGKTYTMANIIARLGRPALVLAPNKTLAAQLYAEMREFFPKNAVEYFVSYYD